MKRKLRVLCLHGYNSNSTVTKYQLRYMQQIVSDLVEFVHINGVFETPKQLDPFLLAMFDPPFYAWIRSESPEKSLLTAVKRI